MWGIRDRVRRLFGGLTGSVASAASNAPIVVSSTAVEVLILETSTERSGAKLEEGAPGGVCGPTIPQQGSSVTALEPEDGADGKDGALAATLGQSHPPIDNVIDESFRLKASANPNSKGNETNLSAGGHDPNPPRRSLPRKCLALSENDVLIREHPETVVATKGYTRKGWRIRARRVFEGVNRAAPAASVMASVAKAVPVLGTPVEGVLEAFVKVLHLIEQYYSNRDAILDLFERIERLRAQDRAPGASADSPARERLLRQLDTAQLTLHSLVTSGASEAKITSVISDCSKKIDHYLVEVLVSNDEVHSEKLEGLKQDVSELRSLLVLMVNNASLQIATSPQLQGIIIVDPFGGEQTFAKLPGDVELVAKKVQEKYSRNPELYATLNGFIGTHPSLYELTLDDGKDIHPVSANQLATLEPGTKIVLCVVSVITVKRNQGSEDGVHCSSCGMWIELSAKDRSDRKRVVCLKCDRRVHATFDNGVVIPYVPGWLSEGITCQGSDWRYVRELAENPSGRLSRMLCNVSVKLADEPSAIKCPNVKTLIIGNIGLVANSRSGAAVELFPFAESYAVDEVNVHYQSRIHGTREVSRKNFISERPPDFSIDGSILLSATSGRLQLYQNDVPKINTLLEQFLIRRNTLKSTQSESFEGLPAVVIEDMAHCLSVDGGTQEACTSWPTEFYPSVENLIIGSVGAVIDRGAAPDGSVKEAMSGLLTAARTLEDEHSVDEKQSFEKHTRIPGGCRRSSETVQRRQQDPALFIFPWARSIYIRSLSIAEVEGY